jgi:hypothetical protein
MNNKELLIDFIDYAKSRHILPVLHSNIEPLVDDYLSSRNIGNTDVSRSFLGRDEPDAEVIEQAKKLWQDKDIDGQKLQAVKHLMANGWGLKVAHEYCLANFG